MTRQDDQERRDRWKALGIRTDIPHPARVYDYLLGGKDNFAVDREAAEMSLKISPEIRHSARANRQFLVRAVRFLRDNGIRQFLDVGTGLPTSPNTYEVAQAGHPDARVVYVDNDPVVFLHAESLMADNETTTVVRADLRNVEEVLAATGKLLDFACPLRHAAPGGRGYDAVLGSDHGPARYGLPGGRLRRRGVRTERDRTLARADSAHLPEATNFP
jgi:hypothetical protein